MPIWRLSLWRLSLWVGFPASQVVTTLGGSLGDCRSLNTNDPALTAAQLTPTPTNQTLSPYI